MTLIVDIDSTILESKKSTCTHCNRVTYENAEPILEELHKMNRMFDEGHTIILFTGRNWDCYEITKKQLKEIGAKYHELVMGKPQGIIIDDMSYKSLSECPEVVRKVYCYANTF